MNYFPPSSARGNWGNPRRSENGEWRLGSTPSNHRHRHFWMSTCQDKDGTWCGSYWDFPNGGYSARSKSQNGFPTEEEAIHWIEERVGLYDMDGSEIVGC